MTFTVAGKTARTAGIASVAAAASVLGLALLAVRYDRRRRAQWVEKEKESKNETLPSIIEQFRDFQLTEETTIEEANKRRTTCYYEKARDAHLYDLVVGVRSYPRLRNRREDELNRILKYHRKGNMSHRTVIVMCDAMTVNILSQARRDILDCLEYTTDVTSDYDVWIPQLSLIPEQDLHVTVATPWWWHTIRPGNAQLSRDLVARFRQALLFGFHHAFQIELERIVLLGGKTLVALWRCVGDRETEDGTIIYDRHGAGLDPMARLRLEIVRCFTTGAAELGGEPLTYAHRKTMCSTPTSTTTNPVDAAMSGSTPRTPLGDAPLPTIPRPEPVQRVNSIEHKTPGLGDHDGFIHTTLARLPLDCLSMKDVELGPIHRLCREATATYCGHRMVISKFRFLETTGAGGESNPCVDPIFDETIEAPPRVEVVNGGVNETLDLHVRKNVEHSLTIGAPEHLVDRTAVNELFEDRSQD